MTGQSKEYMREWARNNPEMRLNNQLKSRYGITLEEYRRLLAVQNGACAICHQGETRRHWWGGEVYLLAVDHDHETGKTRGLLCNRCNRALGLFGDNVENLLAAATYLETRRLQ